MLIATRAGCVGLNLQIADTVLIYESDFDPAIDVQAMERVHRFGQFRKVKVMRFVSLCALDDLLIDVDSIKKGDPPQVPPDRGARCLRKSGERRAPRRPCRCWATTGSRL